MYNFVVLGQQEVLHGGGILASLGGGERKFWSWGTAVVCQLGQEEEEEALAVRHLWGNLGILLQRRNAALLASISPSSMSKSLRTSNEVRNF